jgi:aryl-alcohol dehydrogenase
MRIQAAILRGADQPYQLEDVELSPGPDEVLVEIVGTGLCHTDVALRSPMLAPLLPMVPGHEGAGIVRVVGAGAAGVEIGDHVVLSFDSCGSCGRCRGARPAHCVEFASRNLTGRRQDGSTPLRDANGENIAGRWFQQSAFATHALATARNVVPVSPTLPLAILGPLGCGVQTGAGAVFNVLRPPPGAAFAVFGAGTVGLSAVMAAAVMGATPIIAVDLHETRLALAKELGATHVLHGDDPDLAASIRRISGGDGVEHALDTTGVPAVLSAAIHGLTSHGVLGVVAVQAGDLTIAPTDIACGRTITAIIEGDSIPQLLIPMLIGLWQAGRLPFDKLITTYPLSEINDAEKAARRGDVVKPVLLTGSTVVHP